MIQVVKRRGRGATWDAIQYCIANKNKNPILIAPTTLGAQIIAKRMSYENPEDTWLRIMSPNDLHKLRKQSEPISIVINDSGYAVEFLLNNKYVNEFEVLGIFNSYDDEAFQ